jgi:DNA-binding transcriptional MerR regulator
MPMTVSEIAERTGHGASKASNKSFIERLHYWTRERLLLPIGKRHPGTGRRRLYPDTADREALILNEMMEAGVSVEDQRRVMKAVHERQQQTPDLWPRLKEQQPTLYLVIETYQGRSRPYFCEGSYTTDPRITRVIAFNLTDMFSVLPDKTPGTATSFTEVAAELAAQRKIKATGGANG